MKKLWHSWLFILIAIALFAVFFLDSFTYEEFKGPSGHGYSYGIAFDYRSYILIGLAMISLLMAYKVKKKRGTHHQ